MKICKDCKHCKPSYFLIFPNYQFAKCKLTDRPDRTDLVTGKQIRTGLSYCSTERMFNFNGECCGREGGNFEPKENGIWKFPKFNIKMTK